MSAPAGYFLDDSHGEINNLSLISGEKMQVWIEYDGREKLLKVAIAPFKATKPNIPLLSLRRDISPVLMEFVYVGFSSPAGSHITLHYTLGWSFQMNNQAPDLSDESFPL